ncbi:MAG: S8 family serine peptidase [Armatimonadota bacterium]|jgi:subtilisin family serine protease
MMMQDRRPVGLLHRFSLVAVTIVVLLAFLTSVGLAAVETEVVSPKLMRVAATGGGTTLVPDLAAAGQILVQIAPGTTREQLQARLDAHGCTLKSVIPNTPIAVIGLPEGMSVSEGTILWAADSVTTLAEPDRLAYPTVVPNDPLYGQQYHWERIFAPTGWDVTTGSSSTVIAVLDSGSDRDHEDLAGRWWINQAELHGEDGVDSDGNGYVDDIYGWDFVEADNDPDALPTPDGNGTPPPDDDDGDDDDDIIDTRFGSSPANSLGLGPVMRTQQGNYIPGAVSHGVHVAGLIGAMTNNRVGVAGHDWQAQIMPVRVLNEMGFGLSSWIVGGIQYAVDNGAHVINMSLGVSTFVDSFTPVIANAYRAGVVVVVAAANDGHVFTDDRSTWYSPVCNDGPNLGQDNFVLGVAATDRNDVAASFTNRDGSSYNFVDVCAPGVDIFSTLYTNPNYPDFTEPYGSMSGTSMACPIVAGLVGLMKAQFPRYTPDNIINQIRITADDISRQNPGIADTLGTGRINTAAALGLDVPPDPVSNLVARDTPGDEGGSITVTWTLSPQDSHDVTGYTLMRARESGLIPNTPGSFSLLANLPPGTSAYIDAPVPDDVPFWYQVITHDESNSVPSAIAGPARARDDLPPPPIENLVAVDTQADEGGAITLSWLGYEPPDDLEEYRIYRAMADITNVADMEPIAVLPHDARMHYIDRTTVDGTEYWYAVTGVDDVGNEEAEVNSAGPVISNPNFAFSYPAGLSMISVGAVPSEAGLRTIADILRLQPGGEANLAYWDPTSNGGEYILWSQTPGASAFTHQLGRSWWLRTPRPIIVNISGQAAPEGDFQKQVVSGWNQIGNPFPNQFDFSTTQVTGIGQGTPVNLATSNQLGYTRDYAWSYDTRTNSYRLIAGVDLPFATKTLDRARGALFLARRPATLLLKRQVLPAADSEARTAEFDGWALRLVAETQGMADTDNFLGVCANAEELSGMVSPPRPDADLDLYFVRPAADGGRFATDFVAPEATREWEVRVACAVPGATVRVSWPDLSDLPGDIRPMLVDNETGRTIYLRTSTGYSYEVGEHGTERSFTLRIADEGAGALAINTLSAAAAAGRAQIVYALSQDASVDIEVLNIAGVTVRRIIAGRVQQAGPQQVTWDGRNAAGVSAPSGRYIVRVTARSDDGQQVSAIRSLQLQR